MTVTAKSSSIDLLKDVQVWQRFDSVYFMMWAGWRDQLESNRWHWGKRWAERLPVVFVQPELLTGSPWRTEPEGRLENVNMLSIESAPAALRDGLSSGMRQAGHIASYMRAQGHCAPLLWLYNPLLAVPFLLLPALGRVFHGTENYFDFSRIDEEALNFTRFAIEASDLAICCSTGVAAGFAASADCTDAVVIPNGCDYWKYRDPRSAMGNWPERIRDWLECGRRLAVFAGNINSRLDLGLMAMIAAGDPNTGFIYAGPVETETFTDSQRESWENLLQRGNVRALGRIPAEDLPDLYHHCDVGIIPYRNDMKVLVENGFPLKALEMSAAGLPVISTLMKPLRTVPDAVIVTETSEEFCAAFAANSRKTRLPEAAQAADRVCRDHDYDLLFDRMLVEFDRRMHHPRAVLGSLALFAARVGNEHYREMLTRLCPEAREVCDIPVPRIVRRRARWSFPLKALRQLSK